MFQVMIQPELCSVGSLSPLFQNESYARNHSCGNVFTNMLIFMQIRLIFAQPVERGRTGGFSGKVFRLVARTRGRAPRSLVCSTNLLEDSFSNRGTFRMVIGLPKLWNQLPPELRVVTSVDQFRKHLKTYLFKLAYDV